MSRRARVDLGPFQRSEVGEQAAGRALARPQAASSAAAIPGRGRSPAPGAASAPGVRLPRQAARSTPDLRLEPGEAALEFFSDEVFVKHLRRAASSRRMMAQDCATLRP